MVRRQHIWAAIAAGLTTEDTWAVAGISPAVAARWFRQSGGMPSVSQAPLSSRYLSFIEREEFALLRASGCGVRVIARHLHGSPSTLSRELRRNAATRGGYLDYRALTPQWRADRRARRPKPAKLAINAVLRHYMQDRLAGTVTKLDGAHLSGPAFRWIGRRHGRRQDRRWATSWILSKSPTACHSISAMIRLCRSRMRRSALEADQDCRLTLTHRARAPFLMQYWGAFGSHLPYDPWLRSSTTSFYCDSVRFTPTDGVRKCLDPISVPNVCHVRDRANPVAIIVHPSIGAMSAEIQRQRRRPQTTRRRRR
jgi:hypothetical protein